MKVKTYAPAFCGFYESIWDIDTDNYTDEDDRQVPYDRLEIDWGGYKSELSRRYCQELPKLFPDGMLIDVEYESVVSPREYNFMTDSINCTIDIDTDKLREYLEANWEDFRAFIRETYTSRDGFISWHSNHVEDWKIETENFTMWEDTHKLGGILDFVAEHYNDGENLTDIMYGFVNKHEFEWDYITYKPYDWGDLSTEELTDAVQENISKMDLEFGYTKLLVDEAKHKAEVFGSNWVAELEDSTKIELLSSIRTSADELKIINNQKVKN